MMRAPPMGIGFLLTLSLSILLTDYIVDANSNVSVPLDVNNEDYQLIMQQVKDGTLTIEEAD